MPSKQILYYRSKLDNELQPLPISETDPGQEPKALVLDVTPGAINDLNRSADTCQSFASYIADAGESAVVAKPCGRGPGSMYQGPAEVDFFEAVDFICRTFPIDRDRISITGGSMGGASTWHLTSHNPDFFSAAAPFCGYCDYRIWLKPGGTIIRTQDWQHHSWEARDAIFRVGNLSNIPLWIVHGEWDTPIGGGVSTQHSRNMVKRLTELGIPHTYTEVPECGHECMLEEVQRKVFPWMVQQQRKQCPESVDLTAHTLRHNKSFYLRLDAFEQYGIAAHARADLDEKTLSVTEIENVMTLTLGPVSGKTTLAVSIDGNNVGSFDLSKEVSFAKTDSGWQATDSCKENSMVKRHFVSGPAGDIFYEPIRIVLGTQGSAEENFILDWLTKDWVGQFMQRNGGVHRGIFDGESRYIMQIVKDTEVTDEELETCNLILAGTQNSNAIYKRIADKLPLSFGDRKLKLLDQEFSGEDLGALAVSPSPFNPDRYVLAIGGATPRAAAGSTHLGFQLLPDYMVWDGENVCTFGFFNSDWQ